MAKKQKKYKNKKNGSKKKITILKNLYLPFYIKQIILTILSIGILFAYFSIPFYKNWIKERIVDYYKDVPGQLKNMKIEKRLAARHGYNYLVPKIISEKTPSSAVVLLPTKSYVKNKFSTEFIRSID